MLGVRNRSKTPTLRIGGDGGAVSSSMAMAARRAVTFLCDSIQVSLILPLRLVIFETKIDSFPLDTFISSLPSVYLWKVDFDKSYYSWSFSTWLSYDIHDIAI